MVFLKEHEDILKKLGDQYFVKDLVYVADIKSWAEEKNVHLSEPSQPMKLIPDEDNKLIMIIQSEITEESLANVLKGLSIRWALKDTAASPEKMLNSDRKKLAYCFLKEYARTVSDVGGDEMIEDDWAIKEMANTGFFEE